LGDIGDLLLARDTCSVDDYTGMEAREGSEEYRDEQ